MSHWIIYALFFYLIYKFVKGFLFPAIHITNTVNHKMREMQSKMNEMQDQQQQRNRPQEQKGRKIEGDYIDYEEIK